MSSDQFKQQAAEAAMDFVEPGMKLGLGTGSTAAKFVDLLGARVAQGLDVLCVPTSQATYDQAKALDIKLTTLDEEPQLDLTVDGADELTPRLELIKGGGGALLREKIVAVASDRMIVIADHSKKVATLGAFPLPVELVEFGLSSSIGLIGSMAEELGYAGEMVLRETAGGELFKTDSGNVILDCAFGEIPDPEHLGLLLSMVPGAVENGLFLDIADVALVAGPDGVEMIEAVADDEDGGPELMV